MSMNSSVAAAEEESGWTAYLEDFSCNNNTSSSLISDAAWNGNSHIIRRRLNQKNSSKCMSGYGDDLEDTATSPLNSPKVSTMKKMEVNHHTRIDDHVASCDFLVSSANNFLKHHGDGGDEES